MSWIFGQKGANKQASGIFFKVVLQMVLIFGPKMGVVKFEYFHYPYHYEW